MDPLTVALVIIGFGGIALAGARFGAGSTTSMLGLFARSGQSTWPHGIQESDAPHFALDHIERPDDADPGRSEPGDAPSSALETVPPSEPHWRT